MSTKRDLINGAFSRCRISGLTVIPDANDLNRALRRLENMAAMWFEANIDTGYQFEDDPNPATEHQLKRSAWNAYESNLAIMLLADYGKAPMPTLVMEAQGSYSALLAATAKVGRVPYPTRMPVGSGNSMRYNRWQNYYKQPETVPNESATVFMVQGEIRDFVEHFDDIITNFTEVISTYTVEVEDGLTLVSDSLASPDVNYRISATGAVGAYVVKITVTTTFGRVVIRKVNFAIEEIEV